MPIFNVRNSVNVVNLSSTSLCQTNALNLLAVKRRNMSISLHKKEVFRSHTEIFEDDNKMYNTIILLRSH